jgi:hypothetical protein
MINKMNHCYVDYRVVRRLVKKFVLFNKENLSIKQVDDFYTSGNHHGLLKCGINDFLGKNYGEGTDNKENSEDEYVNNFTDIDTEVKLFEFVMEFYEMFVSEQKKLITTLDNILAIEDGMTSEKDMIMDIWGDINVEFMNLVEIYGELHPEAMRSEWVEFDKAGANKVPADIQLEALFKKIMVKGMKKLDGNALKLFES